MKNINTNNVINVNNKEENIMTTDFAFKLAAALDAVGGKDAFLAAVKAEKKETEVKDIAAAIADAVVGALHKVAVKAAHKLVKAVRPIVNMLVKAKRGVEEAEAAEFSARCEFWSGGLSYKQNKAAVEHNVEVSVGGGVTEFILKTANKVAPSTTQQLASLKFTKLLAKCKKHTVTVNSVVAASLNSDYSSGFKGNDFASWTLFGVSDNVLLLQCHGAQYGGLLAVDGIAAPDNTADKVRRVLKASGIKLVENVKEIKVACCFGGYNRDIRVDGVRVTFVAKGLYETIFIHEMFSKEIRCYEIDAKTAAWLKSAGNAGLVLDAYTNLLGGAGREEADYVKNVYCKFLRELSTVKTIDDVLAVLPGFNRLPAFKVAEQLRDIVENVGKVGSYGVDKKQLRNALRSVSVDTEAHDAAALALLVEDGNKAAITARGILDAEDICTLAEVVPAFNLLTSKGIVEKAHEVAHDLDGATGGVASSQKLLSHIGQLVADKEVRDYNLAVIAVTEGITLPDPVMVLLEKYGDTEAVFDHEPLSLLKEEWFDDVIWTLRNMFRSYHRVTRYTQDTADVEAKLGKMLAAVKVSAWNERARHLRDERVQDAFFAALDANDGVLPEEEAGVEKVVRSQSVAERILKETVFARKEKGVAITQLFIHRDDSGNNALVEVLPHTLEWNALTSRVQHTFEATDMVISCDDRHVCYFERYTRSILQLVLQDYQMLGFSFMPKQGYRVLYRSISGDGRDKFWVCKQTNGGKKLMVDITTGLAYGFDVWSENTRENGFYYYNYEFSNPSPGELKSHSLLLYGNYVGPYADERNVDWETIINEVTSGAHGAWQAGYGYNGEVGPTYVQMCEFNARETLHRAFSVPMAHTPIRSFAILCGKMKKHGTWGDSRMADQPADGAFFALASRLAEAFSFEASSDESFVEFKEEAILGKGFMARPWYMTKGLMHAVSAKTMLHLVKTWAYAGDPIFVDLTDMTEQQKDLWLRMGMNKWTSAKWIDDDGNVFNCIDRLFLCFYDDEEQTATEKVAAAKAAWQRVKDGTATEADLKALVVDLFADANAAKVGAKVWQYQTGYNVLNQDVKPHHEAVLSTQLFNTLTRFDHKGAKKIAQVLFFMQLQKAIEQHYDYEGKPVSYRDMCKTVEVVTDDESGEEKEVETGVNLSNVVDQIAPCMKIINKNKYLKSIEQIFEKLGRMAGKLNLPVKGTHTYIVPDPAAMLIGLSVLRVTDVRFDENGRVDGGGVTEMFSNTEDAGNVTAEQYIERLHKAVADNNAAYDAAVAANETPTVRYISDDEVAVVVEFVNNMGVGLTAVPADETTARLNEGWDFDGDTIYVYKMDVGYRLVDGVYVWDDSSKERIVLMFANRYPKNHSDGIAVIRDKDCPYNHTCCVWICDSAKGIPADAERTTVVF